MDAKLQSGNDAVLSGVRVLEIADVVTAPLCGRYLADCGCEVIAVERPQGRVARKLPYLHQGLSVEFIINHLGKKSIAIDLKAAGARELVLELARVSDVVLENFRPGVLTRLGLDYAVLKEANPSIVMCSISGWGQNGPDAGLMGVDVIVQAARGLVDLSSPPGERPRFIGFALTDVLAAINAFGAICAALYRKAVTGQGDYIDIALGDCTLAALGNQAASHVFSEGKERVHYMEGSFSGDLAPCGVFKGRNGYLAIFSREDEDWERLTRLMGQPELAVDPRFDTNERRVRNKGEIAEIVDSWLQDFTEVSEAATLLQKNRLLGGAVLSLGQVIDEDPQTKAREMFVDVEHPVLGSFKALNTPLHFLNGKAAVHGSLPVEVGEDTDYILRHILKLDDSRIRKMEEDRIVFGAKPKTP